MDALVTVYSWNTNGIMFSAWMLQVPAVRLQTASSSSSDPAPLHLQQAAAGKRAAAPPVPVTPGPAAPVRAGPACSGLSFPGTRDASRHALGYSPTVAPPPHLRYLLAVLIASAFVWDLSVVSPVTIRSVQTPVRVWTILPGAVGAGTAPAMPATRVTCAS